MQRAVSPPTHLRRERLHLLQQPADLPILPLHPVGQLHRRGGTGVVSTSDELSATVQEP